MIRAKVEPVRQELLHTNTHNLLKFQGLDASYGFGSGQAIGDYRL